MAKKKRRRKVTVRTRWECYRGTVHHRCSDTWTNGRPVPCYAITPDKGGEMRYALKPQIS